MLFGFCYVAAFSVFACLYLLIDDHCGLGLDQNFVKAYLLSLEAMMTIGYGVPGPGDSYMNGCVAGMFVLTAQSLAQLVMSAIVIGVIFQRLSEPSARACTILFTQKAVIRQIDNAHYFIFRLCDMRIQHALIEPHIRCYCLRRHPTRGFEMTPMRLQCPDDELGGELIMTMPVTVVHRIDSWSPLSGMQMQREMANQAQQQCGQSRRHKEYFHTMAWPGTRQRQVDSESGNRDSCVCPTCGDSFGTSFMLQQHCKYNAEADRKAGFEEYGHKELTEQEVAQFTHEDPSRAVIEQRLRQGYLEVVVLVEGIEPTTSATLQARHSYLIGGKEKNDSQLDVEWDHDFDLCTVAPCDSSKGLVLDLSRFHTLHKVESHEYSP
jgi:hypothetical protein